MLKIFRDNKLSKIISVFILINILTELLYPGVAYALTGGPSQPEVQSFEPIGTSEMVDPFSGDFSYNIPLLDIDGYPINISYNSGVTMDQEASWVGLGWNINPGVINRNMRGIPDDFKGEVIRKEMNYKSNDTYGLTATAGAEIFGIDPEKLGNASLRFGMGMNFNNYNGFGFELIANASLSDKGSSRNTAKLSLGLTSSSESGLSLSPSLSFDHKISKKDKADNEIGGSVGTSYNTRAGLRALSLSASADGTGHKESNSPIETATGNSSISSSIDFGMQTYVPNASMPMANVSVSFSYKPGGTAFGADVTLNLSGYYSSQYLKENQVNTPAYGYLNTDEGSNLDEVLLDFNREKDGAFNLNTPALPVTNFTYDVYSVSGQGIGGMYRPFRSDMGTVFDSEVHGISGGSGSLGVEMAGGALVKFGADFSVNIVTNYSGKWKDDNPAAGRLKYIKSKSDQADYEPYYFKQAGEKFVDSEKEYFTKAGGYRPVRVAFDSKNGFDIPTKNTFINDKGEQSEIPAVNTRTKRQRRNEAISILTREEADNFGLNSTSNLYPDAPKHHVSEISSIRTDGARYVYGIPAYNYTQEETSFSVGESNKSSRHTNDCTTGLVSYHPNKDNHLSNEHGLDNYYTNTTMPAYAHSYLLTAVLSPDYVDLDNVRGPSVGDLGTYTKLEYTKSSTPYKWRVPLGENMANSNENLKSNDNDDQANYIYGEKELWYLSAIKSKNYTAIFYKSPRGDGYGVEDKNGKIAFSSTNQMMKLDSIRLFSNNDLVTPIKTVVFEYDYSLCENIPNRNTSEYTYLGTGKLTLKKIYFTYGNSKKGILSPYQFLYEGPNPDYNLKAYDRWGNYKEAPSSGNCSPTDPLSPSEFPYVEQDKTTADLNTAAWSLTKIKLPSGGSISVSYESDDYAYVQDKPAMQMFKIAGFASNDSETDPSADLKDNNFLYFDLSTPIHNSVSVEEIRKKYLGDIKDLYFRAFVKLKNNNGNSYEYVSGYASVWPADGSFGVIEESGYYTRAWIRLDFPKIGDKSSSGTINPIQKAAIQFGRLNAPRLMYGQPNITDSGVEQVLMAIYNSLRNFGEVFSGGPNKFFYRKDDCSVIIPDKSWIRLLNPDKKKLGGGSRVKKIVMSDSWFDIVGGETASYGQEYLYTTTDPITKAEISSGVASYEPLMGGDENPWRTPIYKGDKNEVLLAPDNEQYLEEPLGESFFPSPSVGYSRVTVRNLQYENVKRNATGYVVHEFYTAKDFPTLVARTGIEPKPERTPALTDLLNIVVKNYMTVSQGYVVELNDMHGKPKMQSVYAEGQNSPISRVEYVYKSKNGKLDNEVVTIAKNGTVAKDIVGVDFDIVSDMREQATRSVSGGLNGNLAGFILLIFPAAVPTILPAYSNQHNRFRSTVMTKVINRYGILESTITYNQGSKIANKNLAYDAETGEVLVTQTTNEFMDNVYSLNYPAHWAYDRMGQIYKNIGIVLPIKDGALQGNGGDISKFLVPGDEVYVSGSTSKAWVSNTSGAFVTLLAKNGTPLDLTGDKDIKVIRSGRRNQQGVSIGQIAMRKNPIDVDGDGTLENNLNIAQNYYVLNATATEFSEDLWKTDCNCVQKSDFTNPYLTGLKGNWKAHKSYTYLSNRTQAHLTNKNSDIRNDGVLVAFSPFWNKSSNAASWNKNSNNWTWTSEVTEYSPYGAELENRDALLRNSSAQYGYNYTLPIAVVSNSSMQESGYDGFEDYDFITCINNKEFKLTLDDLSKITTQKAHTGRKSIKIGYESNFILTIPLENCK